MPMYNSKELIRVANLKVVTKNNQNSKTILNDVSLSLDNNSINSVIGENGNGKTTLANALIGILDKSELKISGEIVFKGKNLLELEQDELNKIRALEFGYIPQNAFTTFDPILKIESQIRELSKIRNFSMDEFIEHMEYLSLKDYKKILSSYPFQLSGGMLQRLAIIRAIINRPKFLIADEPTSALDKPIANRVIEYFIEFIENGGTILFITHDIKTALKISSRIIYLKNGNVLFNGLSNEISNFTEMPRAELINLFIALKDFKK